MTKQRLNKDLQYILKTYMRYNCSAQHERLQALKVQTD